jgi:hypothetical protein
VAGFGVIAEVADSTQEFRLTAEPNGQWILNMRHQEFQWSRSQVVAAIASGAGMDGATIFTLIQEPNVAGRSDDTVCVLQGFGSKIQIEAASIKDVPIQRIQLPMQGYQTCRLDDIGGMRHKSAASLVAADRQCGGDTTVLRHPLI